MSEININDEIYELKFNMSRIEMIESQTSMPTLAQLRQTEGFLGISDLKAYLQFGLKKKGDDVFVMPKPAREIAEQLIERDYQEACYLVLEALQRDCPFFFRNA